MSNAQKWKYAKIVDYFTDEIDAGRLNPGDKIPSLQELATQFHCSQETVRGAITMLSLAGLVDTKHGRGSFVTRPDREPAMGRPSDSVSDLVMELMMRLAGERDEQTGLILEEIHELKRTIDELKRTVAELRLSDERDDQFATISRQLDRINQKVDAQPRA